MLQNLDGHLLELTSQELTALVVLVDLFQLGVVLLEVGKVDVGNVDVGVSTQTAVVLDADLATAEGVLVDLGLDCARSVSMQKANWWGLALLP